MIVVEWFSLPRRTLEWFGQTGDTLAKIEVGGTTAIASVVGPPGAGANVGPGLEIVGGEIRFNFTSLTRA